MTNRTIILGGSDWADGQVLYAADLNDTVSGLVPVHYSITGSTNSPAGILGSVVIPANAIGSIVGLRIFSQYNYNYIGSNAGGGLANRVETVDYKLISNGVVIGSIYSNNSPYKDTNGVTNTFNFFNHVNVGSISNTGSLNIQISGTLSFSNSSGNSVLFFKTDIYGTKYLQL
jgi:hypothetical protein